MRYVPGWLAVVSAFSLMPLVALVGTEKAQAQSKDEVVVERLCLAGFSAAFQAAGKVAPPGMSTYTCSCFLDQINQGSGLDAAQSTCRKRTQERFRM
ncbi:hypothetical protein KQ313_11260 [Synechococcus sp. CS-1325]|uniref:hypothetical protein n=1 Tax=unclassified Synechococcus TaxID=2626047 RepID=UPI000DB2BECF|nr:MULTISPECIES: hypothetical protein [unclassified Synechococcus]PZV01609.1 MAG: hypothetical protein DCF24_03990 [Cyanobium sp.]MCT0200257.1 hypothetical protein [Synechococcus sp. CS-1325]MCT0214270.1 hypothetical protein [Synechococcus sp. CS-1326]MCT0234434.1 hypothetical protein [Synechococcus sp. CS-1327]PZV05049.1 MAG: hypothetical protein DCF23_04380 [Cyanobium sp.]